MSWEVNNMSVSQVQDRGISTTINRTLHESNLTITSTIGNNNTHIECLVLNDSLHFIVSEAVFRVQGQLSSFTDNKLMFVHNWVSCSTGKLGECHDLQINSFGRKHRLLKWDPPSTLNITAVEPDISSYIVCTNISTECTTIDVTEAGGDSSGLRQYTFPNLRAYINFTVTAVNIVGLGEGTSVVYEPCERQEGGKYDSLIVAARQCQMSIWPKCTRGSGPWPEPHNFYHYLSMRHNACTIFHNWEQPSTTTVCF